MPDSLVNPSWFSKQPIAVKAAIGAGCLLVLIGAVLFGVKTYHSYSDNKAIRDLKANVNIASKALANAQANVEADKIDVAAKTQAVNDAVQVVLTTANASEQQKANTNASLANLANTIAANVPVGTTTEQIENELRDLDGQ